MSKLLTHLTTNRIMRFALNYALSIINSEIAFDMSKLKTFFENQNIISFSSTAFDNDFKLFGAQRNICKRTLLCGNYLTVFR